MEHLERVERALQDTCREVETDVFRQAAVLVQAVERLREAREPSREAWLFAVGEVLARLVGPESASAAPI